MDEFERARLKHAKNKVRNDAYKEEVAEAEAEIKSAKSAVKKTFITFTINDGTTEHTHTWEAPQLTGTVMRSQQKKDWYMQTIKDLLQKPFGRFV